MQINIHESGLYLNIDVTQDNDVHLLHLGPSPMKSAPKEENARWFRLVEVQEAGCNQNDHHGSKHTGTQPGSLLHYREYHDVRNQFGRRLDIVQDWNDLVVTSCLQFYDDIPVVRSWTEIKNMSGTVHPLEYISSFAFTGLGRESIAPRDRDTRIYIPHSTWFGEAQWKSYSIHELGYDVTNDSFSMKRIHLSSTGTWPASEYLPMGAYENNALGQTVTWQIETTASWNWELSDIDGQLYMLLSGPSYQENQFVKLLKPGESFVSEPCAVAFVNGDFEESIRALTQYRRRIRRPNKDNTAPKVIFNDYMNCLMGDPTTPKLLPLIDAAADAGCDYFCIDCGWYDDGPWWDGVGEWLPSKVRFPGGIEEPLNYIRKRNMIPGLWLELEVIGIHCQLAEKVPKEWFFQRAGRPIIDHGRYQLDYRNPEVRAYADHIIDRLVNEYGVGYIKMDYNINAGPGTELNADSVGEGLLEHTRAYLVWLQSVLKRYPDLVIENCSSGGMRMTYSLLTYQSIQSVSDQENYKRMASIACNCMTALTPEQAAVWSYPLRGGDKEETVFNMVNAILLRVHQSGHLAALSPERFSLVKEGITFHKQIVNDVKNGLPFWPNGLASFTDNFCSVGIDCEKQLYLAVWHPGDTCDSYTIRLPRAVGMQAVCAYPLQWPCLFSWNTYSGTLTVKMQPKTARVFTFCKPC